MATDVFFNIEGIKGESTDDKFKEQMEIQSYQFGMDQPTSGTASSVGSKSTQRVSVAPLTITKEIDAATPLLMKACCAGEHFPKATLKFRRALKGKQEVFWEYELTEVVVSNVAHSGGSSGPPLETVSIVFDKVNWKYYTTDDSSGVAGNIPGGWDLTKNISA